MKPLKYVVSIVLLSLFVIFTFVLPSCKHEPIGLDKLDTVCFEKQILTIFSGACASTDCHAVTREELLRRFDPTSYASIMRNVSPGKPGKSKVYIVVSEPNNSHFMPPSGYAPLSLSQRTLIEVWIEQGAKNTKCSK